MKFDAVVSGVRQILAHAANDEKRDHYFSFLSGRLLVWLLAAAGVVAAAMAGNIKSAPADTSCRLAQFEGTAPECTAGGGLGMMDLELARDPQQIRCLLHRSKEAFSATPAQRQCVEARAATERYALETLDSALFVPLYIAISLSAACWVLALCAGGRGGAQWPAIILMAVSAGLAWLNLHENAASVLLLNSAQADSALLLDRLPGLEGLIDEVRHESLAKWGAVGVWSAALAWLAQRAFAAIHSLWCRLAKWAAILAAVLLVAGVALIWGPLSAQILVFTAGFLLGVATLILFGLAALVYQPPSYLSKVSTWLRRLASATGKAGGTKPEPDGNRESPDTRVRETLVD